jgi:hypothetical protein
MSYLADKFTADNRVGARLFVLDLSPATTVPALAGFDVVLHQPNLPMMPTTA